MPIELNKKDQKIAEALQSEVSNLQSIQDNIKKLLALNNELKKTKELQDEFTTLKNDALPPPSKFRKMLRTIAKAKYYFITHPEKVIEQNLEQNKEILGIVDREVQQIGNRSPIVRAIIRDELEQGVKEVQGKGGHSQLDDVEEKYQDVDVVIKNLLQAAPKTFSDIYTQNEVQELKAQNESLSKITSNINLLIDQNQEIQALTPLQRQLKAIRDDLPKSTLEKIKNVFSKIKNVFKDNSEKALPRLIKQNDEALQRITEDLSAAEKKISQSHQIRREKLDQKIRDLLKNKMERPTRDKAEKFLKAVESLEEKYTKAALVGIADIKSEQQSISESLTLSNINKPIPPSSLEALSSNAKKMDTSRSYNNDISDRAQVFTLSDGGTTTIFPHGVIEVQKYENGDLHRISLSDSNIALINMGGDNKSLEIPPGGKTIHTATDTGPVTTTTYKDRTIINQYSDDTIAIILSNGYTYFYNPEKDVIISQNPEGRIIANYLRDGKTCDLDQNNNLVGNPREPERERSYARVLSPKETLLDFKEVSPNADIHNRAQVITNSDGGTTTIFPHGVIEVQQDENGDLHHISLSDRDTVLINRWGDNKSLVIPPGGKTIIHPKTDTGPLATTTYKDDAVINQYSDDTIKIMLPNNYTYFYYPEQGLITSKDPEGKIIANYLRDGKTRDLDQNNNLVGDPREPDRYITKKYGGIIPESLNDSLTSDNTLAQAGISNSVSPRSSHIPSEPTTPIASSLNAIQDNRRVRFSEEVTIVPDATWRESNTPYVTHGAGHEGNQSLQDQAARIVQDAHLNQHNTNRPTSKRSIKSSLRTTGGIGM